MTNSDSPTDFPQGGIAAADSSECIRGGLQPAPVSPSRIIGKIRYFAPQGHTGIIVAAGMKYQFCPAKIVNGRAFRGAQVEFTPVQRTKFLCAKQVRLLSEQRRPASNVSPEERIQIQILHKLFEVLATGARGADSLSLTGTPDEQFAAVRHALEARSIRVARMEGGQPIFELNRETARIVACRPEKKIWLLEGDRILHFTQVQSGAAAIGARVEFVPLRQVNRKKQLTASRARVVGGAA